VPGLIDREDPLAEMVAKKVIEAAQTGVRDAIDIAALTIMELSTPQADQRHRALVKARPTAGPLRNAFGHRTSDLLLVGM
jgi:hypothetical protein